MQIHAKARAGTSMHFFTRNTFCLAYSLLLLYCTAANSTEGAEQDKEKLQNYLGDMKGTYIVNSSPVVDQIIMGLSNPDPDSNIILRTPEGIKNAVMKSGCRFRSCTEKYAIIYESEKIVGAALISKKCSDLRTIERPSGCNKVSTLTVFITKKNPDFSAIKTLLDWGENKAPESNIEYRVIQ